ncbi:hypothetical protein ACFU5O_18025 [Streptomyces sp. NPDC057445]|uniref:hypothetical protein n=1 Tax=Streptomyces sp. NPDC057445 TaxID=3346136 RepID=UPI00367AFFB5
MLHAVWHRRDQEDRAELEAAVRDAAEEPEDADAAGALRQQIERDARGDEELLREPAGLLPAGSGPVSVTASGERAVAAQTITTAITGDNTTVQP